MSPPLINCSRNHSKLLLPSTFYSNSVKPGCNHVPFIYCINSNMPNSGFTIVITFIKGAIHKLHTLVTRVIIIKELFMAGPEYGLPW